MPACQQLRSSLHRLLHISIERCHSISRGQRAQLRLVVKWISNPQGFHARDKFAFKFRRNLLGNNKTLSCDTRLPVVNDPRLYGSRDRSVEIRTRHHDKWIAATQLQHHLLDPLRRSHAYLNARLLAARQRRRHHSRIVQ